jgi:uncharacterized membrane protein
MPEPAERSWSDFDLGRIVAFSDGVFAIAITLLVLSIDTPSLPAERADDLADELLDLHPELISYAISFVVIGWFWIGHHRLFRSLSQVDATLTGLNLVYLAFVAFTPFPTELLGDYDDQPASVILYALTLAMVALLSSLMWRHALRRGFVVERAPPDEERRILLVSALPLAVFVLSVPLALISTVVAEVSWALIFLAHPRLMRRAREREIGERGQG